MDMRDEDRQRGRAAGKNQQGLIESRSRWDRYTTTATPRRFRRMWLFPLTRRKGRNDIW